MLVFCGVPVKLTVIQGGRDPSLDRATRQIQGLIRQGAAIRFEPSLMPVLTKLGLRLTQIRTMLGRCRAQGFEANAETATAPIVHVVGTVLEELEDQRIVKEYALKVVVEQPTKPGRVAVIDIGHLKERK